MRAKHLKELLAKVPDDADVNIEILKSDGELLIGEEGAATADGYIWLEILGITSWDTTHDKYWHINLGEVMGDG